MATQNQTFKAYYASMPDADLLKLAANKNSYIDIAQKAMAEEIERRHLAPPVEAGGKEAPPGHLWHGIGNLRKVFHH